jgi:hypothetical protein
MPYSQVFSISKYGNKKCRGFHSKGEANRFNELKIMEKAGEIKNIRTQVKYVLLDKIPPRWNNLKGQREISYMADFVYNDCKTNRDIVEDYKGYQTDVYKLKKKMLLARYPDMDFREVY